MKSSLGRLVATSLTMLAFAAAPAQAHDLKAGDLPAVDRLTHPKLDSALAELAATTIKEGPAAGLAAAKTDQMTIVGRRVRVVVQAAEGVEPVREAVERLGGHLTYAHSGLADAFIAPGKLRELAAHPTVRRVDVPDEPAAEAVAGEGVGASQASLWHAAGRRGDGVKVAIIDEGFEGFRDRIAQGDLPASTLTWDFCTPNGGSFEDTGHGTAVAEIVHEMAPGAQLYLLCTDGAVTLGLAKDYAKAQGVHVINASLGYFNTGRGDGTGGPGTPDAYAADARANGILWVNSAGNYADEHWGGPWNNPDADSFLDFVAGDETNHFVLDAGEGACVSLKWDNWVAPGPTQDYDLYLYNNLLLEVASSRNFQNGVAGQKPTEQLCYLNSGLLAATYHVVVRWFAGAGASRMDLFVRHGQLEHQVPAGSLNDAAASPNTLSVAAICWQNNALESYSSQGPTIDGRIKPDIAGQDKVSGATYGLFGGCALGNGFTGTSAAAPHAAGAAALVKGASPASTPAQTQAYLEGNAVDLGTPAKDSQFGAGKLQLPVVAPPPAPVPPPPPAPTPPPPPRIPVANQRCMVPNVKGKTLAKAKAALKARRCATGKVTRRFHPKAKKGRVIAQSRRPGTWHARNAKVNLTLSKGKRRK